ncbi:E3 SUMO-protein ligase KIAA1586 [Dissostichus eleginoides]|uniref:E3 SUMO-protein ligase KIAA1586 n=1 Tax=Dissostichus eleginoides TaxID=100907 RepID=A0AAD9BU00_DISEL|nr:E3 SUMO-protein ligase KIAA1586 [Dissostichus eleginoides]
MKDVLRELKSLSLKLQRRETSLVDASCYIQQTIDVLTAMKISGGKSTQKVEEGIATGMFKDVELSESRPKINRLQFYQSIIDSLKKRLPEPDLVRMLKPLDKRFWPEQRSALILYGRMKYSHWQKYWGNRPKRPLRSFGTTK